MVITARDFFLLVHSRAPTTRLATKAIAWSRDTRYNYADDDHYKEEGVMMMRIRILIIGDLTDVTLTNKDTNSILTDNANRALQGNVAMKVTSNYFCHKNDLSYKLNTLGPLCLWQCFQVLPEKSRDPGSWDPAFFRLWCPLNGSTRPVYGSAFYAKHCQRHNGLRVLSL